MAIKIGNVSTKNTPEDWAVIPDDRQTLIQTLDGTTPIDGGRFESGDKYSFTGEFTSEDWAVVKDYWEKRTKVNVVTSDNTTLNSRRVIIKSWTFIHKQFPDTFKAMIELWAV